MFTATIAIFDSKKMIWSPHMISSTTNYKFKTLYSIMTYHKLHTYFVTPGIKIDCGITSVVIERLLLPLVW